MDHSTIRRTRTSPDRTRLPTKPPTAPPISNIATVTLVVSAVNNDPVAVNDSYQTAENTLLVTDAANGVLANDSDAEVAALQAVLESDAANGVLNLNVDGSFDYTPNAGSQRAGHVCVPSLRRLGRLEYRHGDTDCKYSE